MINGSTSETFVRRIKHLHARLQAVKYVLELLMCEKGGDSDAINRLPE